MKKILYLILSFAIILTASACSKPKPQPSSPSGTKAPSQEEIITEDVSFYFPDEAVMYLCPEVMRVNTRESEFLEAIIQTLIAGPISEELNPSISGDVKVISATVTDGLCTVDLSSEFTEFNTGGTTKESMAVYSIVNTLCGIDGIEKVKINIDGEENPSFGGHFSLDEPLGPDWSMVKE